MNDHYKALMDRIKNAGAVNDISRIEKVAYAIYDNGLITEKQLFKLCGTALIRLGDIECSQ